MRECYIGSTTAKAISDVRDILYAKYRAYQSWGVSSSRSRVDDPAGFEALMQTKFLVGDERAVAGQLCWLREELGIDHLIVRVRWPGLSEAKTLETMRRLAGIATRLYREKQPTRLTC